MADKKSLFDKYKIVGEDGTEKSAAEVVSDVIGGEVIEIPDEELPIVEALTGFPDAVKEALEKLPAIEETPSLELEEDISVDEPASVEEAGDEAIADDVEETIELIDEPEEIAEAPVIIPEIQELETETFTFDSLDEATEDEFEDIKLPDNLFGEEEPVEEIISFTEPTQEPDEAEFVVEEAPIVAPDIPKKEKKVKEPKPPKEKKVKEPKPPKQKKEKPPKVKDENAQPPEPLTIKDHLTFILAIVALLLAIAFVCVKYLPSNDTNNPDTTEPSTEMSDKLSALQIQRQGSLTRLIQSDIDNVFYSFSSTYELQYYQYRDNRMVPVQSTGTVTANVDMGNETLPITIDYVQVGDRIFGVGLFRGDKNPGVYFYNMVLFKLVNMPQGYGSNGKALLVARAASSAKDQQELTTQKNNVWTESFTIDLESGKTTRFLSNVNRNIDMTTGAYVTSFCVLTNEGYTSAMGKIPFFSGRKYDANSGKRDVFVKSGSNESVFATNVYGDYLFADGSSIIFLRANGTTGFDVVRKENGKETTVFSLYGALTTSYLYDNEYLLDKVNGTLYNVKTGKETALVGYRMQTPEMMSISPDGKYLILLGSVNSVMDYQIHIFNLETGDYAKYEEKNFSPHVTLEFIDNTTAMYTVVDPNQGYEYVILDVSKAFTK